MAAFLLVMGLALAWLSVTPSGALTCLHCFLSQRWVDATLSDRSLQQASVDPQSIALSPVPLSGASGPKPSLRPLLPSPPFVSRFDFSSPTVVTCASSVTLYAQLFPQATTWPADGWATSSRLDASLAGLRAPPQSIPL